MYHLRLLSLQHQLYAELELREAFERRIMVKSSYSDILDEFGVPKTTIWRTLNVLFPPKIKSMKHLWDLIEVGNFMRKRVREVIGLTTIKNNWKTN